MKEIRTFNSYNENFILSNMYPVKIIYNDTLFYGVDHLFHFLLFYNHPEIQSKIMKKSKGICANYKAKEISKENANLIKEITEKQQRNLLKKCMRLKFNQSEECKKFLIDTEDDELIEFAFWGDTFWGCILKDGEYQGENNTGKILMELRKEYQEEERRKRNLEILKMTRK